MTANLIDEIMKKVKELRIKMQLENGYILEEGIRNILEHKLTPPPTSPAVKGVDELVEKYKPFIISFENIGNSLASGIVEEFISDLKSLKQTSVKDSQPKEVEIEYKRFGKMTRYILTIPMGKTYGYAMPDYVLKIEKVPYDKGERPQIFVDEWIA